MMEYPERRMRNATRVGMWGCCLLVLILLAPHAGHEQGKSFFKVARETSWRDPGDWPAAWCSVEIVLLGVGIAFVLDCLARLLMIYRRETLSWIFSFATVLPGLIFLTGLYYLFKALF